MAPLCGCEPIHLVVMAYSDVERHPRWTCTSVHRNDVSVDISPSPSCLRVRARKHFVELITSTMRVLFERTNTLYWSYPNLLLTEAPGVTRERVIGILTLTERKLKTSRCVGVTKKFLESISWETNNSSKVQTNSIQSKEAIEIKVRFILWVPMYSRLWWIGWCQKTLWNLLGFMTSKYTTDGQISN